MTRDAIKVPIWDVWGRPITHAVRVPPGAELVFLTGITARAHGGVIVGTGDVDAQTRYVFNVIREILDASGSSLDDVVKVTTYVTEVEHLPRAIAVRGEFFDEPLPATTGIIVKALFDPRMLVEVDVIATVRSRPLVHRRRKGARPSPGSGEAGNAGSGGRRT
jgi:enamine deaminase RidA (YjgF/YER057c/UK114 family)